MLRAEDVQENELLLQGRLPAPVEYPNMSAGGSPPHEEEDAHGDQGVQYCAPLGQRG